MNVIFLILIKFQIYQLILIKWIYAELIEAKSKIEKNIKDYRFDEAAKNAYQFAWHSYCDWYLELSKTILFSDNEMLNLKLRNVSSYVFKQILIFLHPFIPFVTEEIWLKINLIIQVKIF
jgi:valyl-tRNA synthetase